MVLLLLLWRVSLRLRRVVVVVVVSCCSIQKVEGYTFGGSVCCFTGSGAASQPTTTTTVHWRNQQPQQQYGGSRWCRCRPTKITQQQQQQKYRSRILHMAIPLDYNYSEIVTTPATVIVDSVAVGVVPSILLSATTTTATSSSFSATSLFLTSSNETLLLVWLIRITSILVTYIGLVLHVDRPRGTLHVTYSYYDNDEEVNDTTHSNDDEDDATTTTTTTTATTEGDDVDAMTTMICVRPSWIPSAGLGVFAAVALAQGTVLGTYPGVVVPLNQHAMSKLQDYPMCEAYIWRFSDNLYVIDPTNAVGILEPYCGGGSPTLPGSVWFFQQLSQQQQQQMKKPTVLCRINEPPKGRDVNVVTHEDCKSRTVTFVLERDVVAGEELYIDYGLSYDRSRYGPKERR